ncbi:hypothetical protein FOA52_008245, partial [Chlamydomonas sp. UWO 241]
MLWLGPLAATLGAGALAKVRLHHSRESRSDTAHRSSGASSAQQQHEGSHPANTFHDGQLLVLKLGRRVVVAQSGRQAGFVLSDLEYSDEDLPPECAFLVRRLSRTTIQLRPVSAPDTALAATHDFACPLRAAKPRARDAGQCWHLLTCGPLLTTDHVLANPKTGGNLHAVAMQPVPAQRIALWMHSAAEGAKALRQRSELEQQLAWARESGDREKRGFEGQLARMRTQLDAAVAAAADLQATVKAQRAQIQGPEAAAAQATAAARRAELADSRARAADAVAHAATAHAADAVARAEAVQK